MNDGIAIRPRSSEGERSSGSEAIANPTSPRARLARSMTASPPPGFNTYAVGKAGQSKVSNASALVLSASDAAAWAGRSDAVQLSLARENKAAPCTKPRRDIRRSVGMLQFVPSARGESANTTRTTAT
jgi:hypothetical protein